MDYGQSDLNTAQGNVNSAISGAQGNVNSAINSGVGNVNSAATQGQGYISAFNPTDVGGSQLGSTGPQNASQYMNTYAQQVAANPQIQSLYATGNQMYNVPQQAQQATYLQNQVNQALPNAYATSKGFDASNAQVQNAANTQLQFLQPESNSATANLQQAQNLASQYVQAGVAQNQMNLLPIQSYGQYLTQEQNNVFQGLQQQMEQGVQLSDTQMAQYQALASTAANNAGSLGVAGAGAASYLGSAGAEYAGTLAQAQASEYAAQQNNKNVTLADPYGSSTYVNTLTGGGYNPYGGISGYTA